MVPPLLLALLLEPATPIVNVSLDDWERERGVAVNAMVPIDEDLKLEAELPQEVDDPETELHGNSAGGAATATFTSASKADVELAVVLLVLLDEAVLGEDGWKAIMDFKDDVLFFPPVESPLCLE